MTQNPKRVRYQAPEAVERCDLEALLADGNRAVQAGKQLSLLRENGKPSTVYLAGARRLLEMPAVSIVGTREVSEAGRLRAYRLARELASSGVLVMSGLARGVDTAALSGAMHAGGCVCAVIGTPLDKAYPNENALLQENIYARHLLISPFAMGEVVYRGNFPKRNRVMAALSDATVIVEASDTSGTLHQAAECQRLGRWLFIMKSVAENPSLTWPQSFLGKERTAVLGATNDLLTAIFNG